MRIRFASTEREPSGSDAARALHAVLGLVAYVAIGICLWSDLPLWLKAIALVLAVPIATVTPISAFGAALAATPLVFDPVTLGSQQFSMLELSIIFGAIGISVRALWDARWDAGRARLIRIALPWSMTALTALLMGAAVVSLFTLVDTRFRPESLREFRLVIVEPLLFFGLARWVCADAWNRRFAAATLVGTGAVVAAYAIGQIAFSSSGVVADGVRRATGPYPHPNNLALFLERAGILGAAVTLGTATRDRWIAIGAVLCLVGAGLTFSRGAGLAILVGLLYLLISQRRMRGIGALVGAAILTVVLLLITVGDRIVDTGSTGASSTRGLIWRASIDMALDHPIWGVGLDQFLTQYWPRYVNPAGWPERYTAHPHNLVLDMWLRLGILGVTALLGISVLLVQAGRRVTRAGTGADPIALGATAVLLTGFVHGMVDNGFFLPDLAVLTWFAVALIERSPVSISAQSPALDSDPGVLR